MIARAQDGDRLFVASTGLRYLARNWKFESISLQRGVCNPSYRRGRRERRRPIACRRTFAANAVRLQLHALAYNLGNFMRTLAMPKTAEPWSLTSLREKLIKIGAKVVSHGRYVTFQMAEVAVSRQMFAEILTLIARLRAPPASA